MATNFQLKKKYSFDVYPSAILGNGFQNVTVTAILDYETALGYMDLAAVHQDVFPYLPSGTPNRPEDYEYLLVRLDSNQQTVIGVPWINDESVQLVENMNILINVSNVGTVDVERIRAALVQNGYEEFTLELRGN